MSQTPPPPPPPPGQPSADEHPAAPHQPRPGAGQAGWKVATALAAGLGLLLSGTVYVLMDRQISSLEDDLESVRAQLAEAESSSSDPLGGLGDLLGGDLGDLGDLFGDLDGLGDLLGGDLGGLGDLLGGDFGDIDPILFECLSPGGLGMDLGGDGSIPDADIETQVQAVRDILEEERGLAVDGELSIEFVTVEEVQRRAVELTEAELDRDQAELDGRLLSTIGALEPGIDLAQAQLDALDAGVGGFYNPDTGELVIGSEEMDGLGAYITAHEMVHALADQIFGLPDTAELAETDGSDAAYAALNAIEGDATLYGQMFISEHLPMTELLALEAESAQSQAALDQMPHFVRRNLEFPYIEGMTFTCDVFLDGGWDAVDHTYVDLPVTSAQILFPDRYRAGEEAAGVRMPDAPGGWNQIYTDTFGAADLLFLLEAPGGDPAAALTDPKELVRAWAGGEVAMWDRDGDTAVALALTEHTEGPDLCGTVIDYYAAAFPDSTRSDDGGDAVFSGGDQTGVIACDAGTITLGIGPDAETARALTP
ncbi:hypothetical protein [Phytoactinopolyspora mesophila]|uniref:Uncharacterized protein n=1 Tax=Phytoactinopolyspora mesophila TaxID=2650750 RepID=A0A7K3M902_9ACTN|nr:hypothetical protein [Phytoactinopolyspora mesophila]NDL59764.1 hypothetical protein [Phytoactinopolyspora mesophila]